MRAAQRLFPPGKRLLTHWNLRDELKADYADKKDGLAKQRTIQRVMERIIAQDIPAVVIDNPDGRLESVHQCRDTFGRERCACGSSAACRAAAWSHRCSARG